MAVAALLVLLCALGLAMNSSALEENGFSWDRLKEEFLERKLPEGTELASAGAVTEGTSGQALSEASGQALDETWDEEILAASGRVANEEILVASGEKTTDESQSAEEALKAPETSTVEETTPEVTGTSEAQGAGKNVQDADKNVQDAGKNVQDADKNAQDADKNAQDADKNAQDAGENAQDAQAAETAGEISEKEDDKKKQSTYVVQSGDTLTGISIRTYGSEKYIGQICKLNSIKNPDEIKVGQKILLP